VRAPLSVRASANVAVPIRVVLPIVNATIVLALVVILLVPKIVDVRPVYVPPEESVRLPTMFKVVVPGLKEVVPKFKFLNQLAVVSVATLAPVVNVRFAAVIVEPPVVPNVNVLVLPMSATVNPPGPVLVKFVTSAMLNTTVAAVVWVRLIFPAVVLPNTIERTLTLDELNMPVFSVTPSANVSVPAVKVYVPVVEIDWVVLSVTVPAVCVNNGVDPMVAVLPIVNEPDACTKLTVGFIATLLKERVPLLVNVVHASMPPFDSVPPLNAAVLEHVKLNEAKFNVPAVIVNVVQLAALPKVTVKPDALIAKGPNDALLNVYVTLA
jgi:hypothetical protein